MLPPCKVTRKVILALALVATDIALEWVLVAVATHVDGVQDVVGEVDVTVLAVMKHVGVVKRGGQSRGGRAGLAVGDARGAGAPAVFTARPAARAAVALRRRPGLWGYRGRGGSVSHAGGDGHGGRGGMWLLDQERLLVHDGIGSRRDGGLSLSVGLRREAGQLACQGGQLIERVIHHHIPRMMTLISDESIVNPSIRILVGLLV